MNLKKSMTAACAAALAFLCLAQTVQKPPALDLGGEKRIAAYLTTDKMIYRPGEIVRFRVVALDAFTNFPIREYRSAAVKIKGPRVSIVPSPGHCPAGK